MIRDYLYVRDLTDTVASIFFEKAKHEVYNIGSGRGISVNDIVGIVSEITGITPQVNHKEAPSTFTKKFVLDTTRFEDDFGRQIALTSLEEGIQTTYQYIIQAVHKENRE
jgi:UDP-glucose 4-epimerase